MPSKRTNDSVEQIMQELGRKQAEAGVRDSVTERQVDEILKSVGLLQDAGLQDSTLGPISQRDMPDVKVDADLPSVGGERFPTAMLDDILADLPTVRAVNEAKRAQKPAPQAAAQPRPKQEPPRQEPPRQQPKPEPRPRPKPEPQPKPEPKPAPQPQPERPVGEVRTLQPPVQQQTQAAPQATGTDAGDTTRTGIIKNFLKQMAPGDADPDALNAGKEQFKDFFGNGVAVVPDDMGVQGSKPAKSKKKRGLFGLERAEDTGSFTPIDVSLSAKGGRAAPEPLPDEPEEEPPFEEEPPARPAAKKKRGFFAGLFGSNVDEEPYIPESRETDDLDGLDDDGLQEPEEEQAAPPAPQPKPYRSKYTRAQPAPGAQAEDGLLLDPPAVEQPEDTFSNITLSGSTLAILRDAVAGRERPAPAKDKSATGTIYRKKRDTVEFIPGKKGRHKAAPQPAPAEKADGPVGEPVMTQDGAPAQAAEPTAEQVSAEFDIAMGTPARAEDTQEFLEALAAARRGAAAPAAPASKPQPAPKPVTRAQPAPAPAPEVRDGASTAEFAASLDAAPEFAPDTSEFVRGIAASINSQPTPAAPEHGATATFDRAAAILTGKEQAPEQSGEPQRKKGRNAPKLFGTPEDEREPAAPFAEEEAPREHDYENKEDAPAIRAALDRQVLAQTVGTILAGAAAVVLLYLGTAAFSPTLALPEPLDTLAGKTPLLGTMLALLAVACAANWRAMLDGLVGLAGKPSPATMPVLAALGALVQLAAFLAKPEWYEPTKVCLMAGPAALLLCFTALGRLLDARTVRDSFALVSAGVDHAVAYRLRDAGALRAVTGGLAEAHPSVLVSRPTQLFRGFLAATKARRTSDKKQQRYAWLLGACALAGMLFNLIYRKDAGAGLTTLAAVLCLGAPLAGTLISAVPARRMQRSAAQVGAVIPGWKDIRQLGRINVIQVTAQDLFPKGCVQLCGIKPVKKEYIEQAIVYAASMVAEGSPTMKDIFLGMIGDNRKLLRKVDDPQTVYGKGHVGWINGERVLIGNRALLEDYDVAVPSLEFEKRHTANQRRVIYLAVAGKLFSMFQVAYQRDPDTAAVLDGLRHAGLSLIVDCDDFNCDAALLEASYSLPAGTVKVLNGQERQAMAPATAWLPESEGNMLHLGSFASLVGGLEAATGAAEGERRAAMLLAASVLFSCAVAVVMAIGGGIVTLQLPVFVLYQAAWAAIALFFPALVQRY